MSCPNCLIEDATPGHRYCSVLCFKKANDTETFHLSFERKACKNCDCVTEKKYCSRSCYTRYRGVYFWKHTERNGYLAGQYPCEFVVYDRKFTSVSQFTAWYKVCDAGDLATAEKILKTNSIAIIRDLSKQVETFPGFDPLAWQRKRYNVIFGGTLKKFQQNTDLRKRLLATRGRIIVAATPRDPVWGTGAVDSQRHGWTGENRLGELLTEVRNNLTN